MVMACAFMFEYGWVGADSGGGGGGNGGGAVAVVVYVVAAVAAAVAEVAVAAALAAVAVVAVATAVVVAAAAVMCLAGVLVVVLVVVVGADRIVLGYLTRALQLSTSHSSAQAASRQTLPCHSQKQAASAIKEHAPSFTMSAQSVGSGSGSVIPATVVLSLET